MIKLFASISHNFSKINFNFQLNELTTSIVLCSRALLFLKYTCIIKNNDRIKINRKTIFQFIADQTLRKPVHNCNHFFLSALRPKVLAGD